ncbi:FAS-associated factor 1-like isoform X2 [Sycon ciliatum]
MEADGLEEEDAIRLLTAFNFDCTGALAFIRPVERDVTSSSAVTDDAIVQDWQLLDITCKDKISRVAVPYTYTAGQLKHRLLHWFGDKLSIVSGKVEELNVIGLPRRSAAGIEPLCHLQLTYPVHHLEVSKKSSAAAVRSSSPSSSSAATATTNASTGTATNATDFARADAVLAGAGSRSRLAGGTSTARIPAPLALASGYTPLATNGLATSAAFTSMSAYATGVETPPMPHAAARMSPPKARRRRQPDMHPISIDDSDNSVDDDLEPPRPKKDQSRRKAPIVVPSDEEDTPSFATAGTSTSTSTTANGDRQRAENNGGTDDFKNGDPQSDADWEDDDDEEFEDALDYSPELDMDMALVNAPASKGSMIPQSVSDGAEGTLAFMTSFNDRFGEVHPDFFIGPLNEAIQTAFTGPPKDRRLLAVYVHHDESITANVFCSQVLCSMSFINYLSSSCITWPWDVTYDSQRANLLTAISRNLGDEASQALRFSNRDSFPTLVLIMQTGLSVTSLEVASIIPGQTPLDQAVGMLMSAIDEFSMSKEALAKEHAELEGRRQIIQQQEEEFQASLQADREKARQQEAEFAKERLEEEKRQKDQLALQEAEQNKELLRQAIEASLPEEPSASASGVYTIGFRVPGGDKLMRRFLATDSIELLFSFAASKGFDQSEYSILTTFPRKDLTSLTDPGHTTLQEAGLKAREMLLLEEKYSSDSEEDG